MRVESILTRFHAAPHRGVPLCGPSPEFLPPRRRHESYAAYCKRLKYDEVLTEISRLKREYRGFGLRWDIDLKQRVRFGHPAYQTYLHLRMISAMADRKHIEPLRC